MVPCRACGVDSCMGGGLATSNGLKTVQIVLCDCACGLATLVVAVVQTNFDWACQLGWPPAAFRDRNSNMRLRIKY